MSARTLKGYARLNVRIGLDFPHSVKQYVPAEFGDSFLRHGPLPRNLRCRYFLEGGLEGSESGAGVGGAAKRYTTILTLRTSRP